MSNNKQSSVEWLINQALEWSKEIGTGCHYIKFPSEALEQAKAINKQEIKNAFDAGSESYYDLSNSSNSEDYYNKTFNK